LISDQHHKLLSPFQKYTKTSHMSKIDPSTLGDYKVANKYVDDIDLKSCLGETLVKMLKSMVLIRVAETKIAKMVENGTIVCPCHLAIGQEAPGVAVSQHILGEDKVFGAHRSHGHYIALSGDIRKLFAETLGKETGCSRGMGGSMHLIDTNNNLFGTVPIVGGTISIAVGAALSSKMDNATSVSVAFLGDGAVEEGVFHESLNLASVMNLPVMFLVENNLFSSHLNIEQRQPKDSICRFAEAHNVHWERVDGNDVVSISEQVEKCFERMRNGLGPSLIECITYRWLGHVGHREDIDVGVSRDVDLVGWKKRDPIKRLSNSMLEKGIISQEGLSIIKNEAENIVEQAWAQAISDNYPEQSELLRRVYS
jgi:TPP-dependent pyruvate/acetoin dehydrogenase alpha subunit